MRCDSPHRKVLLNSCLMSDNQFYLKLKKDKRLLISTNNRLVICFHNTSKSMFFKKVTKCFIGNQPNLRNCFFHFLRKKLQLQPFSFAGMTFSFASVTQKVTLFWFYNFFFQFFENHSSLENSHFHSKSPFLILR
jgi:hypothetical protein